MATLQEMPLIKFSKPYKKLEGVGSTAKLLYAGFINLESVELAKMYKDFIEYDCHATDGTDYELPYGVHILCLFQDCETGKLFTSMRTNTEDHIRKYFGNVGKIFGVMRTFRVTKDEPGTQRD